MMVYPSELAASALQLSPDPTLPRWEGMVVDHCSHCAMPIKVGDQYSPLSAGAFFSNTRDLAAFSGIVCWRCVHLRSKTLLNGLSYSVITQKDVYSIAKDTDKAWLFLTPPEPPFVVVHSSSTMQHLAWRTPVTYSKERIHVRYGDNLFCVRTKILREAMERTEAIIGRSEMPWISPMLTDRKAADSRHGVLNPKAEPFMTPEDITFFLESVGPGERWALAYISHSKRPQPVQPEPITKIIESKHKDNGK
ncbi:TPA: type IV CRISPR-associated protein Csf1 [Pseudomonas aeruginosa]|nr:hypothetical protein [Pseudomonas aeruginosa]